MVFTSVDDTNILPWHRTETQSNLLYRTWHVLACAFSRNSLFYGTSGFIHVTADLCPETFTFHRICSAV